MFRIDTGINKDRHGSFQFLDSPLKFFNLVIWPFGKTFDIGFLTVSACKNNWSIVRFDIWMCTLFKSFVVNSFGASSAWSDFEKQEKHGVHVLRQLLTNTCCSPCVKPLFFLERIRAQSSNQTKSWKVGDIWGDVPKTLFRVLMFGEQISFLYDFSIAFDESLWSLQLDSMLLMKLYVTTIRNQVTTALHENMWKRKENKPLPIAMAKIPWKALSEKTRTNNVRRFNILWTQKQSQSNYEAKSSGGMLGNVFLYSRATNGRHQPLVRKISTGILVMLLQYERPMRKHDASRNAHKRGVTQRATKNKS